MLSLKNSLIDKWYEWLKFNKFCSSNTLESYIRDLRDFFNFLSSHTGGEVGIEALKRLSMAEVRSWLSSRYAKGIGARSNRRALSTLRSFFKYLQDNHDIDNTVVFSLSHPIQRNILPRALSTSDIATLLEEMKLSNIGESWIMKRDIALVMVLYGAGLRISEALNLRIGDIDNEELIISGKGWKQRQIFILPIVRKYLQAYFEACPYLSVSNKQEYLFLGTRGKKLGRTYFANRLQKIRRLFNLPEILSPHAFRHSFATHLLQENVDIRSVQQLLGHARLETTEIYTHLNYNDVLDMYENFQRSLASEKNTIDTLLVNED